MVWCAIEINWCRSSVAHVFGGVVMFMHSAVTKCRVFDGDVIASVRR